MKNCRLPVKQQASITALNFVSSYAFPKRILSFIEPRCNHGF